MILVTGATGHLGLAAVSHLLKNTAANNIVAFARDENKASHLREKGIEVRIGTYDDISSLDLAMQGIEKVLLISGNGPNRLQQNKNVVACKKSRYQAYYIHKYCDERYENVGYQVSYGRPVPGRRLHQRKRVNIYRASQYPLHRCNTTVWR